MRGLFFILFFVTTNLYSQKPLDWFYKSYYAPPSVEVLTPYPEIADAIYLEETFGLLAYQVNGVFDFISLEERDAINRILFSDKLVVHIDENQNSLDKSQNWEVRKKFIFLPKDKLNEISSIELSTCLLEALLKLDKTTFPLDRIQKILVNTKNTQPETVYTKRILQELRSYTKTYQILALQSAFAGKWSTPEGELIFIDPEVISRSSISNNLLTNFTKGYLGDSPQTLRTLDGNIYVIEDNCVLSGTFTSRTSEKPNAFTYILSGDRLSLYGYYIDDSNRKIPFTGIRILSDDDLILGKWQIGDNTILFYKTGNGKINGIYNLDHPDEIKYVQTTVEMKDNQLKLKGSTGYIDKKTNQGKITITYDSEKSYFKAKGTEPSGQPLNWKGYRINKVLK